VPFTVLVVCTGNISRSPMTQLIMQAYADPRTDLVVSSAGTRAAVGAPIDRGAATALHQLGIDSSAHRARQFEPEMAVAADLILTAERAHRNRVLRLVPTALHRAFTIKEFARLAEHLDPGEPRAVVAQAAALRGLVGRPHRAREDDVADPHLQPLTVTRATAAELAVAVRTIVGALGLQPADAAPRRRPLPYRR
jgi:protein-tyrosine phosphatase